MTVIRMFYLTIFWILLLTFTAIYLCAKLLNHTRLIKGIDDYAILFFMALGSLVIVAIASKDPVSIAGYTIPMELQWLSSLFAALFGVWRFYLNPLKEKVYTMDREVGEVKVSVTRVESEMNLSIQRVENDIGRVEKHVDKLLDAVFRDKKTESNA